MEQTQKQQKKGVELQEALVKLENEAARLEEPLAQKVDELNTRKKEASQRRLVHGTRDNVGTKARVARGKASVRLRGSSEP